MIHGTALDSTGLFQLERVQEFFKKMKIPLDQVKFDKSEYFDLKTENGRTRILLFY